MADQLDEEESSKRVLVAKKMLKTMGFHEEMLRSIVTSWLVPQFRPEITSELGQSLTRIQDVGFLGISNNSSEGLRPYRMFDIADRMLVDNIDPSAPYCMVSHRWKDPEINLDLLRKARQDVAESYPVWYNPDRNDVEIILKYCKEKVKQQRKDVNGCAVRNRLDEKLSQKGCYVLSLLGMYHQSRKVHAEVREAHANLEKIVRDQKVTEMENRVFRDLNNKAKFAGGTNANGTSTVDADYYDHTTNNPDENHEFIKAAYDRVFDADWERDKQSDNIKFDALSRDLRETVEGMIRCLRLWRSAIKIEQSILRAGEIFDRGLLPGQKQQTSYVWLDTCCIDKSNHNEYSESMSLMGDWYAQSAFTLVHLDTGFDKSPKGSDAEIYWQEFLHTDGDHEKLASIPNRELDQVQSYRDIDNEPEVEWSTRGWTLQELVMSRMTYYVNADWQFLHRPVENLGRAYHLIPYIDLYTEPLEVKPTPNSWKPEVLMTALLNLGAVIQSDALKVVYPRIEKESEDVEIDDSQSLSNRLLTSIAMPWNLMDTVFHVVKPEPTKSDVLRDKSSRDALLHEISVLWDPELAARFPQIEVNEKDRAKQKLFMVPENAFPQNSPDAEERVLHALSIIKALELVGFCFPKDLSRETAKSEMAQAVFFGAVGLIECYDETRYPIIVQRMLRSEIDGNKPSDAQEKELLRLKREAEKRVKLEMRKKLFQELLNSFPEAKEHCAIDEMQNTEEKEEALSKTLAYILHVLVDLVKPLIQEDRQYIADFGNITLLDSWIEVDHAKTEKLRSHASIHSRAEAVPFEIEIISKFIGYIIHPSARPASNQNVELQSVMMRNLTSQISINPNPEPESAMPTRVSRDDTEPVEQPVSPITNQDLAPVDDDISAVAPTEVPLPAGDVDDESLPTGRKSRFVEQLSEAGRTPAASMIDSQGKSQNGDEAVNPDDDITRYLQNWATKLCDGTKVDENALKEQLPGKIQGIKYKIEEQQQQQENLINKMSYFGSSNMVSPHPIIVTNAGIEGIFDVQRVIITMADIDGLRQQVAHTTSTEQVISGYCSISTGFAQVIVRFSCKSGLLRKQLEVIDGIDFNVIKEKSKKNEVLEGQQIRDTDEEGTINRMIKFIQEDDLRLVAGEWVLARCSGVADANWFLCYLELGSTHPFYGYRIPTSEIDFENCIPEDGLVLAWNQYMNRKKEEMCKILTILLKSKERKLKRRRLVGRILRDLAPLDEKVEEEYEDNRQNLVDRIDTNDGQNNHTQNDYDYLDEYAQDRSEGARELRPSSELHSQDSAMSVPQDDMWSAPLDPQSQFTASSFETQYVLPNQELRPEDSVSNIGDQDSRPSQQPPTLRGSTAASKEGEDEDEKSHFWDYLPFIEKVAETKAKHFDKHLSATALKNTPPVLRQAIENLNDNRDFLPAMFHSAKKIHMF
ncbi:hypothetical protein TrVGV298_006445 [Trichoderma virens]|nr:hypothetical protein TrVGV298_006445 [Trichoderma virens]